MSESAVEGLRRARTAYTRFREAVLDLSDDPNATNIARYLSASRALDIAPAHDPRRARRSRYAGGPIK
ncbi:MAG TPA: hypothetical protein VKB73_09745 [Gaiellaceae bacterium]|nr:hypothetical protein [Gaiellaceae bacterium]